MKKIIIPVLSIVLIISLIAVGILSYKFIKTNKLYTDNKPLHCAAKFIDHDGKYDLYFHFKDSILNKYTLVYTKEEPLTETAYENWKKTYLETNSTSILRTNKVMQFSEK